MLTPYHTITCSLHHYFYKHHFFGPISPIVRLTIMLNWSIMMGVECRCLFFVIFFFQNNVTILENQIINGATQVQTGVLTLRTMFDSPILTGSINFPGNREETSPVLVALFSCKVVVSTTQWPESLVGTGIVLATICGFNVRLRSDGSKWVFPIGDRRRCAPTYFV